MKPSEYKCIRMWGQMMSSYPYFIESEQAAAARDNAPVDAVYRGRDGKWVRFADVTNQNTIDYFAERGFIQ